MGTASRTAGPAVAEILAASWREPVAPWTGTAAELDAVAPLLLHGGVAALGWRRLDARLRTTDAALLLQEAHRMQALRAVLHEQAVARSFRVLAARGVAALLGKGWAAARLYPDPSLRAWGDVDVYLRAEQLDAAREAAAAPDADCPIDLHPGFGELDDRAPEELEAGAVSAVADGVEVRVLGPEHHLRLLALHALRHGLLRPLWLCDVAAAVESRPASFDWDLFRRGDSKRTRWALAAIRAAHDLLGARLDGVPETRPLPRWFVPAVWREWGTARPAHGARRPMADAIRRPAALAGAIRARWPNPVEATIGLRGTFGAWPLPLQLGECARRSLRFAARGGRL